MTTPKQQQQQQEAATQQVLMKTKSSGTMSFMGSPTTEDKDEDMSRSVLSAFQAKEEEIEKKKMEVKARVQLYLGRVEEETKRLADIREELEALDDPKRKEVAYVRKRIDTINKELRPLGFTCQKKEREYKEALEAFNEKSKEKSQCVAKLMELVSESETLRFKKLEELSKHIESLK
ncbi:hypothetical protein SOVF_048600 [Spinacia oleracea]|uniref:RAB6-interacting golgin n=1 Tax=Spinacia oleracea TaxID=3562 RepID=A0A9R0I052_SPIOL|nr:uncharacterized protein LOC110785835 [Spinacia oleracea]XP_021846037.1 uncharacterized protein LOC110785835 [Spinacia oleracea]KNA20858.1 hypothetical protein SOVF_048600 [Spinacia oleracea]